MGRSPRTARPRVGRALLTALSTWTLPLLAGASGCDWRRFDDLADSAPVRSIGAPDAFKAGDFGRLLLPLEDPQPGVAAAFVASSANDLALTVIKLDIRGEVSVTAVDANTVVNLNGSAVIGMAEIPATMAQPTQLILGTPEVRNQSIAFGRVFSMAIAPNAMLPGNAAMLPGQGMDLGWGRNVATGPVMGSPGGAGMDIVVAGDTRLAVQKAGDAAFVDAPAGGAASCDPQYYDTPSKPEPRYLLKRALLLARFWQQGPSGSLQIAAATTRSNAGSVSFFGVAPDGTSLTCLAKAEVAPPKRHFGQSLAAGDFNGDGAIDLLVGAPPQHAYIYLGPFPAGGLPQPVVIEDPTGLDFGFRVAALDIDGVPGDEAIVSDPRATVDGQTGAGRVVAYSVDATTSTVKAGPQEIRDRSPATDAGFGTSVHPLRYCAAADMACPATSAGVPRVLMVGAANEVFVYFRTGANVPQRGDVKDVRIR